jgi:hypothetical protein
VSPRERWLADLRILGEALAVIVTTWLLLGWFFFDRPITQSDGTVFWAPYIQSSLHAGVDWTNHLYRFGVVGGSEMHEMFGTQPVVQLCGLLGLSTTATLNVITVFAQLCFGFLGVKAIEALVTTWSGAVRRLSPIERIIAIWACGFAPVLGWRLALGHENLVMGLVPFVAAITLLLAARAGTSSVVTLAFAAFAVLDGLSGPGQQLVIYSAIFGLPLLVAVILDAPRGTRWGTPQWVVVATLGAALLVALPRVAGMIAHAMGPDAARGLAETVTYSFGAQRWLDWLGSLAWTTRWHELAGLAIALWPPGVSRKLLWGMLAGAVLAALFASDVTPISDALLRAIPPLRAFRVPARAILPVLAFVPVLALAACFTFRPTTPRRSDWLWIAAGVLAFATGRLATAIVREPVAWLGCVALVAIARWRPARWNVAALAVVAGLGVAAFDERFPREVPFEPIEEGPRRLHDALIAQVPDLAMPLARVQIVDAPPPYDMSTAFAAELASLDGDYNPPRRFLELLSALEGKPVPATTVVFVLARSSAFPYLQQLYNVRVAVSMREGRGTIEPLPDTPGPAWFPAQLQTVDAGSDLARALRGGASPRTTGWLLRADGAVDLPAACAGGTVDRVTTDAIGQRATLEVTTAAPCALVVATTYVTALHATDGDRELAVFPIDVALTGIAVPAGKSTIVLAPQAWIPWWSWVAAIVGALLLLAACAVQARRSTSAT